MGSPRFAGHLFAFFGRRFDRTKIPFWDRGGLVLHYQRASSAVGSGLAVTSDGKTAEMDMTALAMLLDGVDVKRVSRPALSGPRLDRRTQGIDNSTKL